MIKTFERAKRALINKNVEKNKFNQTRHQLKFLRVVHYNQIKVEFYKNFVILDKDVLNLMWSDFVESSILNDKTRYFVTFLCDFIKRLMIYVFRVKSNTFENFWHFHQYNEHENNQIRRFRIDWEKKYLNNEFNDYRFKHDIQ